MKLYLVSPVTGDGPVEDSTMPIVTELVGAWLVARLRGLPSGR